MDRRVTPLSGLPHLPGVPNLHINRPLFSNSDHVIFSRQLPFFFSLIMHTYARGCMCIRRHLKEQFSGVLITWSERENKT